MEAIITVKGYISKKIVRIKQLTCMVCACESEDPYTFSQGHSQWCIPVIDIHTENVCYEQPNVMFTIDTRRSYFYCVTKKRSSNLSKILTIK